MESGAEVDVRIDVQWGDMDALGHVNNAKFFSWFESARIALFMKIGVATSGGNGVGPILATTTCDFLKPVVHPATVRVRARITKIGESSMTMEYAVEDVNGATPYARGTSVAVLVDYGSGQKVRVPDDIRARAL